MTLKILQLNIFQGKFLPEIFEFIKKRDFDILHFQEVTNGSLSRGGTYRYAADMNIDSGTATQGTVGINCFEEVKKQFGYNGEMIVTYKERVDPSSFYGNAIFYKKDFRLVDQKKVILYPFSEIDETFTDWERIGRGALFLKLEKDGKQFWTCTTHLAWSPNDLDTEIKIEQSQKIYDVLKTLDAPFIFSGDMNANPQTKAVSMLDDLAINLTKKNTVTNTLNPHVHKAKHLFPKGLPVDMFFVSPGISVKNFRVINGIDLSDHLGLVAEVEA